MGLCSTYILVVVHRRFVSARPKALACTSSPRSPSLDVRDPAYLLLPLYPLIPHDIPVPSCSISLSRILYRTSQPGALLVSTHPHYYSHPYLVLWNILLGVLFAVTFLVMCFGPDPLIFIVVSSFLRVECLFWDAVLSPARTALDSPHSFLIFATDHFDFAPCFVYRWIGGCLPCISSVHPRQ